MTLLEQALFICAGAILGMTLGRVLRLDLPLGCTLAGFAVGQSLPWIGFDTGIRAHNLQDIVFYIILPILVLEAAWQLRLSLLRNLWVPALLLAVPGLLITAALGASLIYYGIAHPTGFPWAAALLASAILAATDPTTLIPQLRRSEVPAQLTSLIDGESLCNDAGSVVLYGVALSLALGGAPVSAGTVSADFLTVLLGGTALGLGLAAAAVCIILVLGSRTGTTIVSLFMALTGFYIAEYLLQISGIIAVVTMGVIIRRALRRRPELDPSTLNSDPSWQGQFCSAVLFTLLGLVITLDMFSDQWLAITIAIAAMLVARTFAVMLCAAGSRVFGRAIPLSWQLTLSWGGLRGAVAIALVLSLPDTLPYWYTLQSMVFGVVLFSLIVQGGTTSLVTRKLRF